MRDFAAHVTLCVASIKVVPDSVSWITASILLLNTMPTHVLARRRMLVGRLGVGVDQTFILHLRLLIPTLGFSLRPNVTRVEMWAWTHTHRSRGLRATSRRVYLSIWIRLQDLGGTIQRLRVLTCSRRAHAVTRLLTCCAAKTGSPRMQVR